MQLHLNGLPEVLAQVALHNAGSNGSRAVADAAMATGRCEDVRVIDHRTSALDEDATRVELDEREARVLLQTGRQFATNGTVFLLDKSYGYILMLSHG